MYHFGRRSLALQQQSLQAIYFRREIVFAINSAMRLCRRQMGPRCLGVALQEIALRQANLATRGVKDGSGFVPPPYAVSQEIQPAVRIAELVNRPAFACLTVS